MSEKFSPFIDNYETFRKYVNRAIICGSLKNILGDDKETTERNTINKIKVHLGDDLKVKKDKNRKVVWIENDRYTNDPRILKNTYKSLSVSDHQKSIYIFTLHFLKGEPKKRSKLFDILSDFSNRSIYKTLEYMEEEGIIFCKNKEYSLSDDIFAEMSDDDLMSLSYASEFFAMKAPFSVPGLFLQDTISLYRKKEVESPIIYQHYFPHHISNDNQAHIILESVLDNKKIRACSHKINHTSFLLILSLITLKFLAIRQYACEISPYYCQNQTQKSA